jgi:predicted DCC family thiol-disulfide oxidoreductase YuxK
MTPDLYRRCQQALHVWFPDGRLLRGGIACLYILETLGYRRTARFLRLRPCRWAVEAGYWLVARNRWLFSRFMFTRE